MSTKTNKQTNIQENKSADIEMMRMPDYMYLQQLYAIFLFPYAQKTDTGTWEFQPASPTTGLFSFLAPRLCIECHSSQA